MSVRRLEDLVAWQLSLKFKLEVYRIVTESPTAMRDFKFRDQIYDAACGVEMTLAEGFVRYRAGQIIQFFTYARASLAECRRWLADGVHRGHFAAAVIEPARFLAIRCDMATLGFIKGLLPFLPQKRREQLMSRKITERQLLRIHRVLRTRQRQRSPSPLVWPSAGTDD